MEGLKGSHSWGDDCLGVPAFAGGSDVYFVVVHVVVVAFLVVDLAALLIGVGGGEMRDMRAPSCLRVAAPYRNPYCHIVAVVYMRCKVDEETHGWVIRGEETRGATLAEERGFQQLQERRIGSLG